ncbi:MAG: enoyl-CoA hydratase/isomerase family protein [Pseudolabrys sp.]|nr:enoyl-CoA hydratase/isomerase family protein [Pseudolabrys sp.]
MSIGAPLTMIRDDAVVHVRLSRAETLNVIDQTMATALAETFERLGEDSNIRVVTLRGEGKSFMAGGDLRLLRTTPKDERLALLDGLITDFHRAVRAIRKLPAPVIAGVQGAAAGAGFSLALACDLVVAGEKARFVPAYGRIGATPDGGLTWSLCQAVGRLRANEILMLGGAIDAMAAQSIGLINRIVPECKLDDAIDALAKQLAAASQGSVQAIKKLVRNVDSLSFEEQLDREHEAYRQAVVGQDFETGLKAFFGGQPPRF